MADLKISIAKTLVNEGGYTDTIGDPGDATKYGVTQADMPNVNIKDITEEQATTYYQEHYVKALYSDIAAQAVADKLFDMGVLFGIGTAVKILQETLGIEADGDFGPETLTDTNGADPVVLLQNYKTRLVSHALAIVGEKSGLRKFITGWIRRVNL